MYKKVTYILLFIFLVSCAESFDSVKRGLTGAKRSSADEFLVKKKDPLILPPEFESLPTPADSQQVIKEVSSFEKTLKQASETEITSSSGRSSVEDSILKKIRKK